MRGVEAAVSVTGRAATLETVVAIGSDHVRVVTLLTWMECVHLYLKALYPIQAYPCHPPTLGDGRER
jgi:hypothetical protein